MYNLKELLKTISFFLFCIPAVLLSLISFDGLFLLLALPLFLLDDSPNKTGWGTARWYSYDQNMNQQYSWFLNWLFKPKKHLFGCPDETLSSVFAKEQYDTKSCAYVIKVLNFIDPNHDKRALELDEGFEVGKEKEI